MLQVLLSISALHWLVLLTPGANFFMVGQLAASGKRSTAVAAAFGITTVTFTWATLAVLGVGIVFSAHPLLRHAFQLAGGLYLLYVGLKMLRSEGNEASTTPLALSHPAAFRMGFVTNFLNPKTALFFGGVFATVMPPHPSTLLIVAAVLMVYVNALVWHLFLAIAFSHSQVRAAYARQRQHLAYFSGSLIGAFGARLLWTTVQEMRAPRVWF